VRQPVRDRLPDAMERATTDFQRAVLAEWGRRNPRESRTILGTKQHPIEIVPSPCTCTNCKSVAVIIPDNSIEPARGFVLCPRCSMPSATVSPKERRWYT
jgi:hypothetical protein